jgi:hypothetical protein
MSAYFFYRYAQKNLGVNNKLEKALGLVFFAPQDHPWQHDSYHSLTADLQEKSVDQQPLPEASNALMNRWHTQPLCRRTNAANTSNTFIWRLF